MRRGIQVYALHFEDEQSIVLGENGVTSIEPDPDHRGRFTVFVDGVKARVVDTDDSVDYCTAVPDTDTYGKDEVAYFNTLEEV